MTVQEWPQTDVLIAGAGIIGLSLALELHARGLQVTVLERDRPLAQASTAAAGMLALHDPHNPAALYPLAHYSAELYPAFLHRIAELSGQTVPFQTQTTLQQVTGKPDTHHLLPWQIDDLLPNNALHHLHLNLLHEHSIDPHQLADALLAAVRNTSIKLLENTHFTTHTPATIFVDCRGAWTPSPIKPRKGQMLSIELPSPMHRVLRTEDIYIVPRTTGPHAGRAIIGATIEDIGFDLTVHPADIDTLLARATTLLPSLANARILDTWAGLRPGTPDDLPILGAISPTHFIASGHFRNGILLAPATAHLIADLIESKPPTILLDAFSPHRFPVLTNN